MLPRCKISAERKTVSKYGEQVFNVISKFYHFLSRVFRRKYKEIVEIGGKFACVSGEKKCRFRFRSERWKKICQPRINLSRVVEKSSAAFDGRATLKNIVDSLKNPEKHSRNACRTLVQDLQNTRLVWKRTLAENWWNVGRNVGIVSNRNIESREIFRKKINSIRVLDGV